VKIWDGKSVFLTDTTTKGTIIVMQRSWNLREIRASADICSIRFERHIPALKVGVIARAAEDLSRVSAGFPNCQCFVPYLLSHSCSCTYKLINSIICSNDFAHFGFLIFGLDLRVLNFGGD
jgi:hypothetical protein